jgi:DNA-binding NarL/FixJ family response regulator
MMDHPQPPNDSTGRIKVLCVDDTDFVAEALRRRLAISGDFEWLGLLGNANNLEAEITGRRPDVVVLDVDMPGRASFDALQAVSDACPDVRVIMLSGHVRADYINRSLQCGAWGYLSKNEDVATIVAAIKKVHRGEFAFGPESEAELYRTPRAPDAGGFMSFNRSDQKNLAEL